MFVFAAVTLFLVSVLVALQQHVSRSVPVATPCFESSDDRARARRTTVRAFLFADLRGFSLFTAQHGDVVAARVADRFAWLARMALAGDAQLVKTMGDGVLVCAREATDAVRTALQLVDLVADDGRMPPCAAGIDFGTAVAVADDYVGNAVNVAAHLANNAPAGQVWSTSAVANELAAVDIVAEPVRPVVMKHLAEPAPVFALSQGNG